MEVGDRSVAVEREEEGEEVADEEGDEMREKWTWEKDKGGRGSEQKRREDAQQRRLFLSPRRRVQRRTGR